MDLPTRFEKLSGAFEHRDLAALKLLAAEFCEAALTSRRYALIDAGALSYALAKLLEKGHLVKADEWTAFSSQTFENLRRVASLEKKGEARAADDALDGLLSALRAFGSAHGRFATNTVDKAFLKCGAQLYAHGASLLQAAALARVEPRDLSSYVSATKMPDQYGTIPVQQRLAAFKQQLGLAK